MKSRSDIQLAPGKSRFLPEEPIRFLLEIPEDIEREGLTLTAHFKIYRNGCLIVEHTDSTEFRPNDDGKSHFEVSLPQGYPESTSWPLAYAVRAHGTIGTVSWNASTAIDIAPEGKGHIRYGFLSRFSPGEASNNPLKRINSYHLTHLQYYDWMYRHEQLVSSELEYEDAVGKSTSLAVVRKRIDQGCEFGVKSIAYAAIYGAGTKFADDHPRWRLYRRDGKPHTFMDWLSIMDTSPDSGWRSHLITQYEQARSEVGFHGFHMDTYGYPKRARNFKGELVRLENDFPALIADTRAALESERTTAPDDTSGTTLIFNAVNNWPTSHLVNSAVDALYIEVWKPHTQFTHLWRLIREARLLSDKPVILAAYLAPFLPTEMIGRDKELGALGALLYTSAVITSSGASHLILGESDGVLCDPYYVNHGKLPVWSRKIVERYYDFLTAYGPLFISPHSLDLTMDVAHGPDNDFFFEGANCSAMPEAGAIWAVIREIKEHFIVSLVNLSELSDGQWNAPHVPPELRSSPIKLTILMAERLSGCVTDTPDLPLSDLSDEIEGTKIEPLAKPQRLELTETETPRGIAYQVTIPPVFLWRVVILEKGLAET